MAEEGSGGGQSINIGMSIENDAVPKAMKAIQRELDQMEKGFRVVQQTAAQGAQETTTRLRDVQRASEDVTRAQVTGGQAAEKALVGMGAGLAQSAAGMVSLGAVSQQVWARIREDIERTTALAKESADISKAMGEAGRGRIGFGAELRQELRGTMWSDAEGSKLAAQVAAEAPAKMGAKKLGELIGGTSRYAGLMGGREGSAALARDAAIVYDKFGGDISTQEATAFALNLKQAGLADLAGWNTPVSKLITSGMDPQKALQLVAGASEADLGTKAVNEMIPFLTDPAKRLEGHGPHSAMERAQALPTMEQRMAALRADPDAFGFLGKKFRDFENAADRPTVAGAMRQFGGPRQYSGEEAMTQLEADQLGAKAQVAQRDATRARMTTYMGEELKTAGERKNLNWTRRQIKQLGYWTNVELLGMSPEEAALDEDPYVLGPQAGRKRRLNELSRAQGRALTNQDVAEESMVRANRSANPLTASLTEPNGPGMVPQKVNVEITVKSANGSGVDARVSSYPGAGS